MRSKLSDRVRALEARRGTDDRAPFVALILAAGEAIPAGYDDARLILITRAEDAAREGGADDRQA